jgi:tRNA dimethylallyltransferase
MSQSPKISPLIVIVGETATGKSKLALDLAKKLNGEIICADSWTVRRELNIGTDKPSPKDQAAIKHHLIDIVEPCADFTAAVFKDLANEAVQEISQRGKVPIMVGGSGLYIDSVIFDYGFLEPADPELRSSLNQLSVPELIQKIEDLKLPLKDSVDRRNKRRLIRVIESSGKYPKKGKLREDTLVIGVQLSKYQHKEAIERRVDQMISRGLEDEAKQLSTKYGWECEALKGVGYKQWWSYFETNQSLEETRLQIISATNNLAKKQRTWFKRNKSIHWYNQPLKLDEIVDLVTTELSI